MLNGNSGRGANMDDFTFGNCAMCNKNEPLKNGLCASCQLRDEFPDVLKDLFQKKDK